MNKEHMLDELKRIGRAYCEKNGWKFIFANEDKLGFEDKDEQLYTITWHEMHDMIKEAQAEGRW